MIIFRPGFQLFVAIFTDADRTDRGDPQSCILDWDHQRGSSGWFYCFRVDNRISFRPDQAFETAAADLCFYGIFSRDPRIITGFFSDPEVQCALFGKTYTVNLNLLVLAVAKVAILLVLGGSGAVFMKMMSNSTPKRKRGAVFGYRSTANNVGSMLASCFAGWLVYACDSIRSAYYCGAILVVLLIPLTLWIVKRIESQTFYITHSSFK